MMSIAQKHKCLVTRCKVMIAWGLMCGAHFRMIPQAIKDKLRDARAVLGHYPGEIVRQAREAVEAKERTPRRRARRIAA